MQETFEQKLDELIIEAVQEEMLMIEIVAALDDAMKRVKAGEFDEYAP